MKIYKKMFQKRFTKSVAEEKVVHQNPNRRYFVGCWKANKCRVRAIILATDGKVEWFLQKGKYKVMVTKATFVMYAVELSKQGRVYKRRYIYKR